MSYILGYDPETLREKVDLPACRERLDEIGEQRSLPALLERVWLLKVLDRAEDALVLSEQSVRVARMGGTRKDLLRARILHATVLQRRGARAAAIQELTMCAEEHRGKVHFDAGDYEDARADFKKALFLRQESGTPDDQLESTLLAIDTVDRRRASATLAG